MKMKNKLRKQLQVGLLFFCVLFWNCEKEEDLIEISAINNAPKEMTLEKVKNDKTFQEITKRFKIEPFENKLYKAKNNEIFLIDFDNFYKIEKENYTSYTFLIKRTYKNNNVVENLVVENSKGIIQGYIVKYEDIFFNEEDNQLFLNAKISRSPFKGNIEELLNQNNIQTQAKGSWDCVDITTATHRHCTKDGYDNKNNASCKNAGLSNWIYTTQTYCSYNNAPYIADRDGVTQFDGGGGDNIGGASSGGPSNSSSSSTAPILDCSTSSFSLAPSTDCIDVLEEDEEDQIFNELTGKEKCVYEKLKNLKLFIETIKKFENNKNYNLIIRRGNCKNSNTGCTDGRDILNGNITITMEEGVNGNPFGFASNLLHEGIHAEIFKYVDERIKGIDPNDRKNLMYYYWLEKQKGDPRYFDANYQHQHMADKYIKPITEALRKLDNYSYTSDYYLGFAWTGLHAYGFDKYWKDGKLVKLTKEMIAEFETKSGIVKNNTKFNGDDCK